MVLDHFDIENIEASLARFLGEQFSGKTWTALTRYSSGGRGDDNAFGCVQSATANGYCYRCTVPGKSGTVEPAWPVVIGNTVVDGTVTWECQEIYPVIYDESDIDFDAMGKWFFIEFLGNSIHETIAVAPVYHFMVHMRTRGEGAGTAMTEMTRRGADSLKGKIFSLYDVKTKAVIGKLRSVILREFPRETARQANAIRGFNRSLLIQITYGKVGVAYV